MTLSPLYLIAIALGLGLLVGLQREFTHNKIAGIRTFPLITILGTLSGLLSENLGPWVVIASLLGLVGFSIMANLGRVSTTQGIDTGLTTELAILTMFMVGVSLAAGFTLVSLSVTGLVTVLLQWKKPLHGFVERLAEADLWAVARLVLIGLVILPLVPNQSFGPYGVTNPFEIWLMVVLIVGISLGAYVAARLWGGRGGNVIAGILGGLISSTATTVSFAQQSKRSKGSASVALIVIMIASTIVFARVILEIALVSPSHLQAIAPPLLLLMLFMLLLSVLVLLRTRASKKTTVEPEAPEGLRAAIIFGLLYGFILLATAWAKDQFGAGGMFVVASISGLTDVDAITLSTMQLLNDGQFSSPLAWRVVLLSIMSNIVFKGLLIVILGARSLFRVIGPLFALTLLAGGLLLWLWPF